LKWFKELKDNDRVRLWAPFVAGFVKEDLAIMMCGSISDQHKLFLSTLNSAENLASQFDVRREEEKLMENKGKSLKREREKDTDPETQFMEWCASSNLEVFEQDFPIAAELDFVLEGSLKLDYTSKRNFVKQWFMNDKRDGVEFVVREVMDLFRMLLKGKGFNDAAAESKNSNSNILESQFGRGLINQLAKSVKTKQKEKKKAADTSGGQPTGSRRQRGALAPNAGQQSVRQQGGRGRIKCFKCHQEGHIASLCRSVEGQAPGGGGSGAPQAGRVRFGNGRGPRRGQRY